MGLCAQAVNYQCAVCVLVCKGLCRMHVGLCVFGVCWHCTVSVLDLCMFKLWKNFKICA